MRTCKCGKANQPTRKYCIRCGSSLIKSEEKETPQVSISEDYQSVITPQKVTLASEEPVSPEKPSVSTDDRWIRPSAVSRDRVRTASKSVGKSELEKAQEAFAKAEEVDIDGRMLKASELKELMADGPASLVTTPVSEPPAATPASEPIVAAPVSEPPITAPTPESPAATPVPEPSIATPAPESLVVTPPSDSSIDSMETPIEFSQESAIPEVSEVESEPPIQSPKDPQVFNQHEDKKIREVDSDIAQYKLQTQQLNLELEEMRIQYAADVKWLSTVVEQKRIRMEKIEVDPEGAKREFNGAQKEFREAEKLKKRRISEIEKQITNHGKSIINAEKARDKRLKEIDKKKQANLT